MLKINIDHLPASLKSQEEGIVLSGPPGLLMGSITLHNSAKEQAWVQELPYRLHKAKRKAVSAFPVNLVLAAGETREHSLSLQVDPQMEPGEYQASITVGDREVPVSLVVEVNQEIELVPDELNFTGLKPGQQHQAAVELHNLGNVPVVIPEARQDPFLDPDLISRRLGEALLSKGAEGTMPVLDAFVQSLRKEVGGGLKVHIRETGKEVLPGQSLTLHLTITLPKELPVGESLEADVEILDELLSIEVAPAPERAKPAPKPRAKPKK